MQTKNNLLNFLALTICFLLLVGLLLLSACGQEPEPQKIGVFANTNKGLSEIISYGEQTGMYSYNLAKVSNPPKVSRVRLFYVNMPDIVITNSRLFWVPSLERDFNEVESTPLKINIENMKNNMYKILSPELESKKGGYVVLKIGMPLGTADRMYPVQITE